VPSGLRPSAATRIAVPAIGSRIAAAPARDRTQCRPSPRTRRRTRPPWEAGEVLNVVTLADLVNAVDHATASERKDSSVRAGRARWVRPFAAGDGTTRDSLVTIVLKSAGQYFGGRQSASAQKNSCAPHLTPSFAQLCYRFCGRFNPTLSSIPKGGRSADHEFRQRFTTSCRTSVPPRVWLISVRSEVQLFPGP
jgi:hypothetical protein